MIGERPMLVERAELMPSPRTAEVGSRLSAVVRDGRAPGLQCVVASANRVLLAVAAGRADLLTGRPMDLHSLMNGYSMTKPVTAAAVLSLVARGHVALDRPLVDYLPQIPYGCAVTVRHALAHLGGIPNPMPLRWIHGATDALNEQRSLARVLKAHPRLREAPGRRMRYSNVGYWLLGELVERVTGMSFATFVQDRLLRSMGITDAE